MFSICLGQNHVAEAEFLCKTAPLPAPHGPYLNIPFELIRGVPGIRLSLNGSESQLFLVDSGLQRSVINSEAVINLKLKHHEGIAAQFYGIGDTSKQAFGLVDSVKVRFGDILLLKGSLFIGDLSSIRQAAGQPIAGILGYDFIRAHTLFLDYTSGKMMLIKGMNSFEFSGWRTTELSISPEAAAPVVSVDSLNLDKHIYHGLRALLDTGSDRSAFFTDGFVRANLLEQLPGWKLAEATGIGGKTHTLTGLGGWTTLASDRFELDDVAAQLPTVAHRVSQDDDVAFGYPVFASRVLVFDAPHGRIYLLTPICPSQGQPRNP